MIPIAELARQVASGVEVRVPLAYSEAERAILFDRVAWAASRTPAVRMRVSSWPRNTRETAQRILDEVQLLPIVDSPVGPGWQRLKSVSRTLQEGGDCGPRTVAAMALARAAGIRCAVRWIYGARFDHVLPVFIFDGVALDGETLLAGARLGEDPFDARDRLTPEEAPYANGLDSDGRRH